MCIGPYAFFTGFCLDVLLPVTSKIINSSLVHGYFPQVWKETLVKPLLKKAGLAADFDNLRPISNLNSFFVSLALVGVILEIIFFRC